MFVLSLKVILAFALTAIPFAYHVWVQPNQNKSPLLRNLSTAVMACLPKILGVVKKARSFLSWYYDKMKTSISARKFFYTGFGDGSSGCSVCRLRNNPLCS